MGRPNKPLSVAPRFRGLSIVPLHVCDLPGRHVKGLGTGPCVAVSRRLQHRTHLDKGYSPTDVLGWSPATDVLDVLYHVV